jgi:hypothetical protein
MENLKRQDYFVYDVGLQTGGEEVVGLAGRGIDAFLQIVQVSFWPKNTSYSMGTGTSFRERETAWT